MMTTRRARGIDISTYQRQFNPPDAIRDEIDFVVLKASQNLNQDGKFEEFYSQTQSLDIPIKGAYHYFITSKQEKSKLLRKRDLDPKVRKTLTDADKVKLYKKNGYQWLEIKDYKQLIHVTRIPAADWKKQADFFINAVKDKDFQFFALDVEGGKNPREYIGAVRNYYSKQDVINIEKWINYVEEETKIPVLRYTRIGVLRDKLLSKGGDNLKKMKLWLAWYPKANHNVDPEVDHKYKIYSLKGISHWHMWQYSADKNRKGPDYGVKTPGIDLDMFNGTVDEMKAWLDGKSIKLGIPEEEEISESTEAPALAENQMDWIITQLEKLIAAGIKPAVEINIGGTLFDVEKLKTLKETLEAGGITPEVNLSVDMSSNGSKRHRTTIPVDTNQPNPKTPPDPEDPSPKPQDSFTVRAKAMNKKKKFILLYKIGGKNNNKYPIMDKIIPVIRINNDEQFSVSKNPQVFGKRYKNGKIKADGDENYYLITDYSGNSDAIGTYVNRNDVKRHT
jgi:GH25 family lysozyme M1 (1,4-beta-N-acetylmuramidase)